MALVGAVRAVLLAGMLASACGPARGRDLEELVLRDSTYLDPSTLEPYSGPVYRVFPDDPERIQLEGRLREGAWNGELTVYHANGRIRYQGRLVDGAQCGAWIENATEEAAPSLYEEIVGEIENLSVYPECPG